MNTSTTRPRLRLSCDACSTAKIKCDKAQPICSRCTNNGFSCTYSVSRRYGKPSLARRMACEREKAAAATANQPNTFSPDAGLSMNSNTSTLLMDVPTWDTGSLPLTNLWPSFELGGFGDMHFTPPMSSADTPVSEEQSRAWTTITQHDCEARAIAVLRSLQHHTTSDPPSTNYPGTPRAPTPNSAPAEEVVGLLPSFDDVLNANKNALKEWVSLMQCPCSHCPHLSFLYMSILWKLLFWYRVAVTGDGVPQVNLQAAEPQIQTAKIGKFNVQPTLIRVGNLELDSEEQADLRKVLVKGELKKLDKTIEEMTDGKDGGRGRGSADQGEGEAGSGGERTAPRWCGLGIPQIRAELKAIIAIK